MTEFEEIGIEAEEDLIQQDYNQYNQAVMWSTDWTSETIVSQLKKGNIDLNPNFQRRNAWNDIKKSCLIESLILGVPVPAIILAERKDKKNSYIVLDGKQRLLTLMQFYSTESDSEYTPLVLKKLPILGQLEGKTYLDIINDPMCSEFRNQLDNQSIRTIIIRNWPTEEFLYTVFLRLNTGSLRLSPQELRQALHPGEFLTYINNYTYDDNPIRKYIFKAEAPDNRMRDVEYILRFFAFKNFHSTYHGKLKDFLDNACDELNKKWLTNKDDILLQMKELEESIEFTHKIFENNCFQVFLGSEYSSKFNITIFDLFTQYFSIPDNRIILENYHEKIKTTFENLMKTDNQFKEYTAVSTKNE